MRLVVGLMALFVFVSAQLVQAEDYPSRPVRILVPYAPGGVSDIAARLVGQRLTEALGQSFVVENRPGGSGVIAVTATVHAPADGYTLLVGSVAEFTINPSLFKKLAYDVDRDLTPIAMLSDTPIVLSTNGASPYRSVAEVIAAAKEKPQTLGVSTPGIGTFNHITLAQLQLEAGVQLIHVPYRGGAPAATAVAAGDVPLGMLAVSSTAPFLQSGRIRVLAVTTARRSAFNPEWRTLQEEGIPRIDSSNWVGMFAPKDTPRPVVEKLHGEIQNALAAADIRSLFGAGGAEPTPMTLADFEARIKHDTARFRDIIREAGVQVE